MTKQLKTQTTKIKNVTRYGVLSALALLALTACGTTGADSSGSSDIIPIVQPGDSTKSCSELMNMIAKQSDRVRALNESYRSQQTSNAINSSTNSVMSGMPNYGASGSTWGMAAAFFGGLGESLGRTQEQTTQQQLTNAMQRYRHLTGIYNQRCFG